MSGWKVTDVIKMNYYWTEDGMPNTSGVPIDQFAKYKRKYSSKSTEKKKKSDPYDVYDYDDPEDFYYDNYDDFESIKYLPEDLIEAFNDDNFEFIKRIYSAEEGDFNDFIAYEVNKYKMDDDLIESTRYFEKFRKILKLINEKDFETISDFLGVYILKKTQKQSIWKMIIQI